MSRYINPYTDFGFKKLFGVEAYRIDHRARGVSQGVHSPFPPLPAELSSCRLASGNGGGILGAVA